MATGKKVISFSGSAGRSLMGGVSPGNEYLAAEKIFSNAITLWDIKAKKELRTLPKFKSQITKISFSSCGKLVGASSKDGNIVIWKVESGQEIKKIVKARKTLEAYLAEQQKRTEQDGASDLTPAPESKSKE